MSLYVDSSALLKRYVDCQPDEVSIGCSVEVTYVDSAEAGHTLPLFRLTDQLLGARAGGAIVASE